MSEPIEPNDAGANPDQTPEPLAWKPWRRLAGRYGVEEMMDLAVYGPAKSREERDW